MVGTIRRVHFAIPITTLALLWGTYDFTPPEKMLVFEEYLVFDAFGMIGSVGGALGLCIGFSFSGVIASIVEFI